MAGDRGPATLGVTICSAVLASIFVAARLFTRVYLVKSVKQDDWWILAALVVALAFSVSICVGVGFGLGIHSVDIGSSARHTALRKSEYAFSVLYNPSLLLTKNSIIVFFLSVMSKDVDPIFKWCNWITLALVNVAGVALTFLNIFQCRPISSTFLYPTPASADCTDIVTLYLSSAPVNIITDLAILFLPIPILTGLRLQRKQKIILVVTFSCGIFVAAVDVVRIAYLQNASINRLTAINSGVTSNQRKLDLEDFSWYASLSFMWSAVEVNMSIICACVPVLKPLFLRFMPGLVHDKAQEAGTVENRETNSPARYLEKPPVAEAASSSNDTANSGYPTTRDHANNSETDSIGFLDMLAGVEPDTIPRQSRRDTLSTNATITTIHPASDFGFVTLSRTHNMLNLSTRESLWPIAVVAVIFFLWGLAYGLLDTLNSRFEVVAKVNIQQGLGLHASYFSGYFFGPLTLGQYMLRKYGFKATMMTGLCVYGCGALTFWPSAVLTSYPAFMVSNFVVAFGLSCLEIAANPYIALCGPQQYAEVRLNLAQGFQAIGTISSPVLARKVLFTNTNAAALVDVQWAYLAIAFFVIGLAVLFYYIPLPEATDEELKALADRRSEAYHARVGPYRVIWWSLTLGVFSQWCYVGGQEVIRGTTQQLYSAVNAARLHPSRLSPADFQTISYTIYMAGRFSSAFLNLLLQPRQVLLLLYTGLIICCSVQISTTTTTGIRSLVVNQLIYLFESGIFAQIFAITLRGMGEHTKLAAALLTSAISGGAVFPVVQWATERRYNLRISFVVPLVVFAVGAVYPVYLNGCAAARNQMDPARDTRSRRTANEPPEEEEANGVEEHRGPDGFKLSGIIERAHRLDTTLEGKPTVQHVERQGERGPTQACLSQGAAREDASASSPTVRLRRPDGGVLGELKPWPCAEGEDQDEDEGEDRSRRGGAIATAREGGGGSRA